MPIQEGFSVKQFWQRLFYLFKLRFSEMSSPTEKEGTAKVDNRYDKPLCRNGLGSCHVSLPSEMGDDSSFGPIRRKNGFPSSTENSKIFLVKVDKRKWENLAQILDVHLKDSKVIELFPQEVELLKLLISVNIERIHDKSEWVSLGRNDKRQLKYNENLLKKLESL